jgi:hypothetical protein
VDCRKKATRSLLRAYEDWEVFSQMVEGS